MKILVISILWGCGGYKYPPPLQVTLSLDVCRDAMGCLSPANQQDPVRYQYSSCTRCAQSIGVLANSGFFPQYPEWKSTANQYAQVWEDSTLHFFNNTVPQAEAQSLLKTYVSESNFSGPSKYQQHHRRRNLL
jgi:hypothetical protein